MDALVEFLDQMVHFDLKGSGSHAIALRLGAIFLCATVIAKVASKIKYLPKVTAYLLVGVVLGTSSESLGFPEIAILDYNAQKSLVVVYEIALALILFLVGADFRLEGLSKRLKRGLAISLFDVALTFGLTATLTFLAAWFGGADVVRVALPLSVLLGILACEIGPASTLAVARESSSHGPYTDHLRLLVGSSNLMTLCLFAIASAFIFIDEGTSLGASIGESAWRLLIPLPVGALIGLALAWGETLERKSAIRLLMTLSALMAAIGLAHSLSISTVLTVMVVGFAYANASVKGLPALDNLRVLETPFYVIFFIYAGAHLDVTKLGGIGLVGVAYVVARFVGKYYGVSIGAKKVKLGENRPQLLGLSSFAHSAIVLALMALVLAKTKTSSSESLREIGETIATLILGSVVVFEVFGPILVKVSVLKSGEVSIVNAVSHKSKVVEGSQVRAVVKEFLSHLGLWRKRGPTSELATLVIEDRHALASSASFNKVTKFIGSYPYDSFPVLNKNGFYIGYVSFNEIKDTSYDPIMKDLIRAADLIGLGKPIDLDNDDIHSAYERVRELTNTSLPVIRHDESGNSLLVGVILQRDLAAAHLTNPGTSDRSGAYASSETVKIETVGLDD